MIRTPAPAHLDFLANHGDDTVGHTDHGLLEHLKGTYGLLAAWGYR